MKNPELTQKCNNLIRAVRQQISLLATLRRVNECNDLLDSVRLEYWKCVQEGHSPEPFVEKKLQEFARRIVQELNFEQKKVTERKALRG